MNLEIPADCPLAVTVLGSGGPRVRANRVSSGYLVWVQGRPRLLVDAGGGTFQRLGALGVDPSQLDAVLITHTHIDHTGGLAPLVFAAWMQGRQDPLTVVGPSGRGGHPGCVRFCDLLFGPDGAWSYLHSFEGFAVQARETPAESDTAAPVWESRGVRVSAVGVPHGMMPAVAYRVDYSGRAVSFSGDVEGAVPSLQALAQSADLLVHDQALPGRDVEHGHLHPPPDETGRNAARAHVGALLLTHFMPEGERALDDVVAEVRAEFHGDVLVAHDLLTVGLDEAGHARALRTA